MTWGEGDWTARDLLDREADVWRYTVVTWPPAVGRTVDLLALPIVELAARSPLARRLLEQQREDA